jgi:hypothetical protein
MQNSDVGPKKQMRDIEVRQQTSMLLNQDIHVKNDDDIRDEWRHMWTTCDTLRRSATSTSELRVDNGDFRLRRINQDMIDACSSTKQPLQQRPMEASSKSRAITAQITQQEDHIAVIEERPTRDDLDQSECN